jgi:bifunctional UDP-N-acetylglucosamine pyrophosphorylase / glucosamine-1-phosphate N-acetyltransferase
MDRIMSLEIIVLAAGQGTRMRSARPKVLQTLAGRPMLAHVLDTARALGPARIHVVIGHGADAVRSAFADDGDLTWAHQPQQHGTGDAVRTALPAIADDAIVLVLYGDVPLVTAETLRGCLSGDGARAGLVLLTMRSADPQGLGRIIRDADGGVCAIVEEKDATPDQRAIDETNSGIIALEAGLLRQLIGRLTNDNAQSEFLLTDIVALAVGDGVPVSAVVCADAEEMSGVNDRKQLSRLERAWQRRATDALMAQGVTLYDPARVDVRGHVTAGMDCEVDIDVVFEGRVELGARVSIGSSVVIRDARIGDDVRIEPNTVIDGAEIGTGARVGPFARLRPGTVLGADVRIGNFVEAKAVHVGKGSKANHLAYLGDADLGSGCNIGAGTIICNYDGVQKHHSTIGNGVFVGSNSTLVSPIEIADGAFVAAGSTVTSHVGRGALAVGRARQRNIDGWTPPARRSDDGT